MPKKLFSLLTALTLTLTPTLANAQITVTDLSLSGNTVTITIESDEEEIVNVFSASYTGGTQILGKTVNNTFYGLVENVD